MEYSPNIFFKVVMAQAVHLNPCSTSHCIKFHNHTCLIKAVGQFILSPLGNSANSNLDSYDSTSLFCNLQLVSKKTDDN